MIKGPPKDARNCALLILEELEKEKNRTCSEVFSTRVREASLSSRDRALTREIVFGVLRYRLLLDHVIGGLTRGKRPPQPVIRQILRMAGYQFLFLHRIPSRAIVHEAVTLAKTRLGKGPAGFVNAVLRHFPSRDPQGLEWPEKIGNPTRYLSLFHSHPEWMVDLFCSRFGIEKAERLLQYNNTPAPLTLRLNRRKITVDEFFAWMKENHPGCIMKRGGFSPDAVLCWKLPLGDGWPPLQKGWVYIQDEAMQLVGLLADPRPGMRIVDVCSAPGGKTTHMAEITGDGADLIALDISDSRLEKVRSNCRRLGLENVRIETLQPGIESELREKPADLVLVDAPCSGLGILRRQPDLRWKKSLGGIRKFPEIQLEILEKGAGFTREGGCLIYSTCTLTREENEDVVVEFLKRHPGFSIDRNPGLLEIEAKSLSTDQGFLTAFPPDTGTDGFFAVRLKRE